MLAFDLEKFRTRWLQWLGQKTRVDRDGWSELLRSNWAGWVGSILRRSDIFVNWYDLKNQNPETIKKYWKMAIRDATREDLSKLDGLYADDLVEKMDWE